MDNIEHHAAPFRPVGKMPRQDARTPQALWDEFRGLVQDQGALWVRRVTEASGAKRVSRIPLRTMAALLAAAA